MKFSKKSSIPAISPLFSPRIKETLSSCSSYIYIIHRYARGGGINGIRTNGSARRTETRGQWARDKDEEAAKEGERESARSRCTVSFVSRCAVWRQLLGYVRSGLSLGRCRSRSALAGPTAVDAYAEIRRSRVERRIASLTSYQSYLGFLARGQFATSGRSLSPSPPRLCSVSANPATLLARIIWIRVSTTTLTR